MIGIRLEPVDTWFFRDGTPFSAGNAPQTTVASLFPPHPTSMTGALRAALALSKGWHGRGRWSREFHDVLGNGPDDLGSLAVDGPFLLCCERPLFRAPRHLLGSKSSTEWKPEVALRPGCAVSCDLGSVRLPEVPGTDGNDADLKPGANEWLTQAGMNAVLRGKLPSKDEIVSSSCLWSTETRIGLEIDRGPRTAKEGMLYSAQHTRPHRGLSLGARIAGLPPNWVPPFDQLVPLGGESRLAECRKWSADITLDTPWSAIIASKRVMMIALTPLLLDKSVYLGQQPLEGLGAIVVSACLDRPQRIGGWNSLVRSPLPLQSALPPGSVLFCEKQDERLEDAAKASDGLMRIGFRQRWGFGLIALGVWSDE